MNVKKEGKMEEMLMVITSRAFLFSSSYFSVVSKFCTPILYHIKIRKKYIHTHPLGGRKDIWSRTMLSMA